VEKRKEKKKKRINAAHDTTWVKRTPASRARPPPLSSPASSRLVGSWRVPAASATRPSCQRVPSPTRVEPTVGHQDSSSLYEPCLPCASLQIVAATSSFRQGVHRSRNSQFGTEKNAGGNNSRVHERLHNILLDCNSEPVRTILPLWDSLGFVRNLGLITDKP